MNKSIRIVLAEDHALVRAGFRNLLRNLPDVEVVAEVTNGREVLLAVAKLHPTLVLMDIGMPELNGLEALSRISKEYPSIKVLIVSLYDDAELVSQAFQRGAAGYLLKCASPTELDLAIQAIVGGKTYLDPRITQALLTTQPKRGETADGKSTCQEEPPPLRHLTSRQREVLQLVTEGKSSKEIAVLLEVTVKTIEMHRGQLMQRLNIHNVAGLVRYAVRHGIISPG